MPRTLREPTRLSEKRAPFAGITRNDSRRVAHGLWLPDVLAGHLRSSPVSDESNLPIERAWPWVLRVAWFGLALTVGPLLIEAGKRYSGSVKWTILAVASLAWSAGFLATLIPHPIGLVTVRCGAGGAVVWATGAAIALYPADARVDAHVTVVIGVGLVWAVVVAGVMLYSETGQWSVNGPAYPNERRFLLRPGAAVQVVIVPLSVLLLVVGVTGSLFLLAAKQWLPGIIALAIALPFAIVVARSLYALAKRFVVFVPAGFVLHDMTALREPVLFRRQSVEAIGAASADTDALDLTLGAAGLAMEIRFLEKVELTVREGRKKFREGRSARFLFVPTLPGRMLGEARKRRFPML